MIDVEQHELLAQAVFAFARCSTPTSKRCYPLTQAEIEALHTGGIEVPAAGR
jgi:hypothetical protein